jgi:N-acetylglucosamine malate deacetylase 1
MVRAGDGIVRSHSGSSSGEPPGGSKSANLLRGRGEGGGPPPSTIAPCDVLALGAHPDDVELGCGATIARLAAAGRRVAIADLTAGESATRGTPELRAQEAMAAAVALAVVSRTCLGLPDGGVDAHADGQIAAVVRLVRSAVPRLLLLPHPGDPHPDHAAAAALAQRAAFLAGVARWRPEMGAAHRPRLLLAYPGPRQLVRPDLVVDVSQHWGAKRAALDAHASQFSPGAGEATHLASGFFLRAVEGRDRAAGNTIGCELGEGFTSLGPLPADELAWLLAVGGCP